MTCKYCGCEVRTEGLAYPEVRMMLHYKMVHGSNGLPSLPIVAYPRVVAEFNLARASSEVEKRVFAMEAHPGFGPHREKY